MSVYCAHKHIQKYKASRSAVLNGINYAYVVAPFLYDQTSPGFFKKFVFSVFYSTRVSISYTQNKDLLIYYSCRHKNRTDYDYIPQKLYELLEPQCDYLETTEKLSAGQPFKTIMQLAKAFRLTRGYQVSAFQRLGCTLLIAKYLTSTNTLRPLLLKRKKLVTFCDAQAPENLMAQIANSAKVRTFTTQHGQYRILDSSNMSPDAEAYSNFVSNYMLCWGEATRNEFIRAGFKSDQFIITGWIKRWAIVSNHGKPTSRTLGVMLNGEGGRDSNIALLDAAKSIANTLGLPYIVRLHPWSKPSQYTHFLDERCKGIGHYELTPYLQQVNFSIAHMTGATIELLHAGAHVYLLDDGKLADVFRLEGLSFKSSDAIASAIAKDSINPKSANNRFKKISNWFNTDSDQDNTIRKALLDEEI